jgi:putative FmdB family regulatory protein
MPTYSFICDSCEQDFEIFFYIKDYNDKPKCLHCKSKNTARNYIKDVATQNTSVKKSDSELKTLGDLAKRNTDRMSDDYKHHLYSKHNSYRENESQKELPKGMSRVKKPSKPNWKNLKHRSSK